VHDYDHATDPIEYSHHTNCEYNADNANREVNEAYQPQWSEYEGEVKRHELECREDEIGEYEEEKYEPKGLKYEGYEHGEPMYEPEHNAETDYAKHGLHGFEYDEHSGEYIPSPSFPTPAPTPCTCNAPCSNQ
jgi:hypothetical protein